MPAIAMPADVFMSAVELSHSLRKRDCQLSNTAVHVPALCLIGHRLSSIETARIFARFEIRRGTE